MLAMLVNDTTFFFSVSLIYGQQIDSRHQYLSPRPAKENHPTILLGQKQYRLLHWFLHQFRLVDSVVAASVAHHGVKPGMDPKLSC